LAEAKRKTNVLIARQAEQGVVGSSEAGGAKKKASRKTCFFLSNPKDCMSSRRRRDLVTPCKQLDKIILLCYNVSKKGGVDMKNIKNRKFIYVILSVVVLVINALPIMIHWGNAAMTQYSIVSIAFAVGSVVYAVIAFAFRNKGNLFVAGKHWLYRAISMSFFKNESKAEDEAYRKEFELSAFIYCVTIPTYITFAFFANGFYSALSQALGWTIVRLMAMLVIVIVPPIVKGMKAKKQQRIKDEADRKEQEHRESMGKWK